MMKTLTMPPASDESLRLLSPQNEIKSTNIQEILSINNNENGNVSNTMSSIQSSKQLPFYLGISEVLPSLYLCGACAIVRPETIENLGIKFVVNATVELPDTPLPDKRPDYMRVAMKDSRESNLIEYFDEVADKIEKTRQQDGKSLVHCVAGVSRSVSLVLAYLMKYADMSLKNAFAHVRSVRPQVRPNVGFFKQLIEYEQRLHGCTTVSMIHCSALGEEIPDVYEPEYRTMELLYQKYRRTIARR
ncbi:CLUMA_CG019505, isoform A [Clunio marinus]|uniref:CLUMA_CG019505, isoform A n=1 Tax=Clunio marinus TaxID=568069 RepID=A0A1J1J2M0_9DIPT|nr:CLUMA_CG019505, isoform A [Clunio marinus]